MPETTKEEIGYHQNGDYMLPNIVIGQTEIRELNRWGMMHREYLENEKRWMFTLLRMRGELFLHLYQLQDEAEEMYSRLIKQMSESEGVTEQMKQTDQMQWVQKMNNIKNRAEEIVKHDLIYHINRPEK